MSRLNRGQWDAEWETGSKRLLEEFDMTWDEAQTYQSERSCAELAARVQEIKLRIELLSLLSGGERALTAIGLLFALLKVKPSYFCVLDEIEASLDDVNISRFAQYIHGLSDSTQFLVSLTAKEPWKQPMSSMVSPWRSGCI
ncbi:RecF/RecN/SMC N terminal domain-containing protein [Desulfitobacterium chlororespirans DSM 11544]|uniref:RecF/RecN/SMC N terminal domain-containing protein n=1 Tax=Desulfitobacterium chlororespirans DSM 11544 TaxID=1121395 RepID=A0A1M7TPB3_9FIRM|nr:RecF/RecN/SMC N terminal domain-containing protein [Desulfitobacterium chlororespirans DSM 11544]